MSDVSVFGRGMERWLQPLGGAGSPDGGAPCGPDLEYDDEFLELLRAAQGKPAAQFVAGEPPDWPLVRHKAEALLDRSRDLRLAVYWTRAAVNLDGFAALVPGLRLVRGLLETFWEDVHPLPEDGDTFARANALAMLSHAEGLRGDLGRCVLCSVRGSGDLRLRAVAVAFGQVAARPDEEALSREQVAQILAAAAAQNIGWLEMVEAAMEAGRALAETVAGKFGPAEAPDLGPLLDAVRLAHDALPAGVSESGASPSPAAAPEVPEQAHAVAAGAVVVRTRDDAMRAIDLVCEFLERTEPSNPAQMLLRRARRLINQDFLQLIRELAPEALPEASRILGVDPDSVAPR